ncbi:methyltransferase domain-containing protein [Lysobacter sp. SG-8]|uniref:Methyltransferase domain-containing protein n=1 Tax=Marilutibacter penaei TaxID=2759900 RepID=A0A7W3YE07_9GAMM|nr:methyltransferase domain-containing protein [Lysobacter penaei]MBB1087810.1 methyltransferase domain-containing protein [Lysobacter penaei]
MGDETRALPPATAGRIAAAYRPQRALGNYWDYFYTRSKLARDPLYPGVMEALHGRKTPLLDLGCGLGLLAHALRDGGEAMPYRGVDIDAGKVARARRAAARAGLADVAFEAVDLARSRPTHTGDVALLDVLQFVPAHAHADLLDACIGMLPPGGVLVIRTGFDDGGRRARVTRAVDVFSRALGWMAAGPDRYPDRAGLCGRLEAAGLQVQVASLSGNTPFNNWRVLATRPG